MNTSKQVNVMVGLLLLFALGTLLYWLWDTGFVIGGNQVGPRTRVAAEEQLTKNSERGGFLNARNCSSCHGLYGKGVLEHPGLPGLPLNVDQNRPTDPGTLAARQARIRDTIRCGRVGTLMPPWAQDQGGPLNDFQIEQLVTLITVAEVSEQGWEAALEEENLTAILNKRLTRDISESETTLTLDNALSFTVDSAIRIGGESIDDQYEIMTITAAPISTTTADRVSASATQIRVSGGTGYRAGDAFELEDEKVRITSVSGNILTVERGVDGTRADDHPAGIPMTQEGDQITVQRAQQGTQAIPHAAGAQVYAGPVAPPTGPLVGETGTPPCGQLPVAAHASPAPESPSATPGEPVTGPLTIDMGDNFFLLNGQRNPTITVRRGQSISVTVRNVGRAPHNMRVAGDDNRYNTADDAVSSPLIINAGGSGTFTFTFQTTGTFDYQCDIHPTDMKAKITVVE